MTDGAQTVEFQVAAERQVDPADWAARAVEVRESLAADGLPASDMAEAMNGFRFLDESGVAWMYDGTEWLRWDGQAWAAQAPPAALRLQPFTLDWLPDPTQMPPAGVEPAEAADAVPSAPAQSAVTPAAAQSGEAPAAAQPAVSPAPSAAPAPSVPQEGVTPALPPYRATHRVPPGGMPAWSNPDPRLTPQFRLDPWLDVMVVEAVPSGWARIQASNGWTGWVDGRLLVPG
jgi:hypothetical protein